MNRLEKLSNLTREDWVRINIGADLIVGFPGENEADFADTLDIVKRFQISNLHAFPFSPHEGMDQVPAAHFPEAIPDNIKTRRWNDLMQAGKEAKRIFLESQDGKILELLPEAVKNSSNYLLEWRGYSENHIALNALNFTPINTTKIERWVPVSGVYHFSQECLEIPEASEQDGE